MKSSINDVLYQKTGLTVSQLAQDLMSRVKGERIPSISEYEDKFQVSRGTIQNSLNYLKEQRAVVLVSRGHLGPCVEDIDYQKLQACSVNRGLLGSMPLAYSHTYQGLATALYRTLSLFSVNMVYARGAEYRLQLVAGGVCQFAVCSMHAARQAIDDQFPVDIAVDLGPGSYLSRHVLLLRDPHAKGIENGMRVAYDRSSPDQRQLTELLTRQVKGVHFVDLRAHQTVSAIRSGMIDAGVWNMDEIVESGYQGLHIVELSKDISADAFSSAALVVKKGEDASLLLLQRNVLPDKVREIQNAVRAGTLAADY